MNSVKRKNVPQYKGFLPKFKEKNIGLAWLACKTHTCYKFIDGMWRLSFKKSHVYSVNVLG